MSTLNTTNLKNPSSGSNNIVLATDGSTTITTLNSTTLNSTTITGTSVRGVITSGTAVASTSGTAIDFTGIPSWVKRITVMFRNVSTNGISAIRFQIGTSSGFVTTGYSANTAYAGSGGTGGSTSTSGFDTFGDNISSRSLDGSLVFSNQTGNSWIAVGNIGNTAGTSFVMFLSGNLTLSSALDRIRITTANGTDTFDAGTINILYEG